MTALPTFICIALAVATACSSSSSSGITSSSNGSDDETAIAALLTTAVGALSTTGGVLTTVNSDSPPPSIWLANRRQIRIAIARGHGLWVDDLAAELGLPEGLVRYLGEALKRNQKTLSAVLVREPLRVDDWERTLGDVLCCDPWLHPFARARFECRAPAAGVLRCGP